MNYLTFYLLFNEIQSKKQHVFSINSNLQEPDTIFSYKKNLFIDALSRWDGGHYIYLANNGYYYQEDKPSNVAFFPLYPLLIRSFSNITSLDTPISSVIVSNFFFLCALIVLNKLVTLLFGRKVAHLSLVFLVVFPTSFFYSAIYSESVFLFFSITSLYLLEKKQLFYLRCNYTKW